MTAYCGHCQSSFRRSDRKVKCSGSCAKPFHLLCADLNVSFWKAWDARVGLYWFCTNCRPELEQRQTGNKLALLTDLSHRVETMEREIRREGSNCSGELGVLPEELWMKVFQSLDGNQLRRIRMTCRGWNQIVSSSSALMNKLVLRVPKDIILDQDCEEVKVLTSCTSRYSHLVMNQLRIIRVDVWWPSLAQNLESLSITGCQITIATLLTMLEPLHNLKSFTLSSGPLIDARDCPPMVNFQLPLLEKLVLQQVDQADLLDVFRQLCPRLKVFELPTGSCVETNPHKVAQFVKAEKDTLNEIELPMSQRIWDSIMVIDGIHFRRVSLTECKERCMEESHLVELSEKCPNIEILHVPAMSFRNKAIFQIIGKNLINLNQLKISIHNSSFLHQMPKLTSLDISGNDRYSGTLFDFTGYRNENLTSLTLRYARMLKSTLSSFPNIQTYNLVGCRPESWSDIFDPKMRSLRRLSLISCRDSKNEDSLAECFQQLQHLILSDCTMKKSFLIALFSVCPQMTHLRLHNLDEVDDDVMATIGRKLTRLKRISVQNCRKITQLTQQLFGDCNPQIEAQQSIENSTDQCLRKNIYRTSSPQSYEGNYYDYYDSSE